ncbi:hypothetical protein D9M68_584970 [compost metagenome]
MSKSVQLSQASEARLGLISPSNGYATDLKAVYTSEVPDDKPKPMALLSWVEDETRTRVLTKVTRNRAYVIEGVFPRSAELAELERFHQDVLRALGWAGGEFDRPLPGEIVSDTAEILRTDGGAQSRRILITIQTNYVENYA